MSKEKDNSKDIIAKFNVPIEITKKQVADLLVGAIEGGSTYWCEIFKVVEPKQKATIEGFEPKDIYLIPLSEGGELIIGDINDPDFEHKPLNLETIQKGLIMLAEKHSKHFSDFINENSDAETSDVFLQCCLYGEVIFS